MSTDYDEFVLKHYGVKGMRWGKRQAGEPGAIKSRAREIRGARRRMSERQKEIHKLEDEAVSQKTDAGFRKVQAQVKAANKAYDTSPDRATAVKLTRGEQAAAVFLAGPFGLIPIVGSAALSGHYKRKAS